MLAKDVNLDLLRLNAIRDFNINKEADLSNWKVINEILEKMQVIMLANLLVTLRVYLKMYDKGLQSTKAEV